MALPARMRLLTVTSRTVRPSSDWLQPSVLQPDQRRLRRRRREPAHAYELRGDGRRGARREHARIVRLAVRQTVDEARDRDPVVLGHRDERADVAVHGARRLVDELLAQDADLAADAPPAQKERQRELRSAYAHRRVEHDALAREPRADDRNAAAAGDRDALEDARAADDVLDPERFRLGEQASEETHPLRCRQADGPASRDLGPKQMRICLPLSNGNNDYRHRDMRRRRARRAHQRPSASLAARYHQRTRAPACSAVPRGGAVLRDRRITIARTLEQVRAHCVHAEAFGGHERSVVLELLGKTRA